MFKGKVCNFKVICNPHVRLARKDLRTHAHVKRAGTESAANSWWCVPSGCARPGCRAGCGFACNGSWCIVRRCITCEMERGIIARVWDAKCAWRPATRRCLPRNHLLCKVTALHHHPPCQGWAVVEICRHFVRPLNLPGNFLNWWDFKNTANHQKYETIILDILSIIESIWFWAYIVLSSKVRDNGKGHILKLGWRISSLFFSDF